jgi:chemotaxis family two-component system response regulator Rcp1
MKHLPPHRVNDRAATKGRYVESTRSQRRILMIEDNEADALLLQRALSENGVEYDVVVIDDGAEAIEYLGQCRTDLKPELIIVDLNLPKEDGIEVLKKYRASPSFVETRMVVLTSSGSPSDRQRAEMIGVNAYLRKPMLLGEFLELGRTLRTLLESSASSESLI